MFASADAFLQLTEEQCIEILKKVRWPKGFRCPKCNFAACYEIAGRRLPLYECAACRYQCSLIAGTVMERSRVPLRKWFAAIDLISLEHLGAVHLAEAIDVTYKTAWLMLHKLRDAMARHNERDLLTGIVRLNIAIFGRPCIPFRPGLHPKEHPFVIGGSMTGDKNSKVLKIMMVQDAGGDTYYRKITPQGARNFIERHVDLASSAVDLSIDDFGRTLVDPLSRIGADIADTIACAHCGVSAKHLQFYLHEYAYRYNRAQELEGNDRRSSVSPAAPRSSAIGMSAEFRALLGLAASLPAPSLRAIAGRPRPGRPDWDTSRNVGHMLRELRAYAASLLPAAASF